MVTKNSIMTRQQIERASPVCSHINFFADLELKMSVIPLKSKISVQFFLQIDNNGSYIQKIFQLPNPSGYTSNQTEVMLIIMLIIIMLNVQIFENST